jgi:hypothetical protein
VTVATQLGPQRDPGSPSPREQADSHLRVPCSAQSLPRSFSCFFVFLRAAIIANTSLVGVSTFLSRYYWNTPQPHGGNRRPCALNRIYGHRILHRPSGPICSRMCFEMLHVSLSYFELWCRCVSLRGFFLIFGSFFFRAGYIYFAHVKHDLSYRDASSCDHEGRISFLSFCVFCFCRSFFFLSFRASSLASDVAFCSAYCILSSRFCIHLILVVLNLHFGTIFAEFLVLPCFVPFLRKSCRSLLLASFLLTPARITRSIVWLIHYFL